MIYIFLDLFFTMECKFCKSEIPDNAKYCPYCGQKMLPDKPIQPKNHRKFTVDVVPHKDKTKRYNYVYHNQTRVGKIRKENISQ